MIQCNETCTIMLLCKKFYGKKDKTNNAQRTDSRSLFNRRVAQKGKKGRKKCCLHDRTQVCGYFVWRILQCTVVNEGITCICSGTAQMLLKSTIITKIMMCRLHNDKNNKNRMNNRIRNQTDESNCPIERASIQSLAFTFTSCTQFSILFQFISSVRGVQTLVSIIHQTRLDGNGCHGLERILLTSTRNDRASKFIVGKINQTNKT